jgi:hypothetical protein
MPQYPALAVAQRFRSVRGFSSLAPRFTAPEPSLERGVRGLQAALDATVAHCSDCTGETLDCDVVRNDGTDLAIHCFAEKTLADRARSYRRDWGLAFRREGQRFRPASLADLARDGDGRLVGRTLSLSNLSGASLLLGDDQLVIAVQSGAAMFPDWEMASGPELGEARACDEILQTRPGSATGPMAYSLRFEQTELFEQRSPRFYALGAGRAAVASALANDVQAWMSQPRDGPSRCRVTFSDSSVVSVLCTA